MTDQADMFGKPQAHAVHTCHWPGCPVAVPPKLWGCKPHWYRLPLAIRNEILTHYRRGQEIDKTPSEAYIKAARAAQDWIKQQESKTAPVLNVMNAAALAQQLIEARDAAINVLGTEKFMEGVRLLKPAYTELVGSGHRPMQAVLHILSEVKDRSAAEQAIIQGACLELMHPSIGGA